MPAGQRSQLACTGGHATPRGSVSATPVAGYGRPRAQPTRTPRCVRGGPTLRRSVRLFREFRYEQPDPARFYTALAEDSAAQLRQLRRPGRRASCSTSAAGPATSATPSRRPARRTSPSTPTSVSSSGLGEIAAGTRASAAGCSCRSATARVDVCYSSNVLEHVRRPVADGRRDGAGHPARRHGLHQLHGLVRPVGRARDRAVALPRRARRAAPLPAQARPRAEEHVRRVAVRGHGRGDGLALGAAPDRRPTCSTCSRATTRVAAGCCGCPLLREVVTWNLVIVLRKSVSAPAAAVAAFRLRRVLAACCVAADRRWPSSRTRAAWSRTPSSTSRSPRPGSWRAPLHLWDPQGAFGQVQNQAYGYLWPMGPFFALGSAGRPAGLGRSSGCGGAAAVRRVPRGAPSWRGRSACAPTWPCLLAGFAFALSPRMLTVARSDLDRGVAERAGARGCCCRWSSGAERGSPRRAAALSALAVAMVGGVNAAATFAVLPLGRDLAAHPDARAATPHADAVVAGVHAARARCGGWCRCSCSAPTARRSSTSSRPPSVTTFPTTLFDALRGTSDWVPYVDRGLAGRQRPDHDGPTCRSTAASCCCSGCVGLIHRRNPHRQFLVLGVARRPAAGDRWVTRARCRAGSPPTCGRCSTASLAPLRNVHKFDPVIRLPLVLGLAWPRRRGSSPASARNASATDGSRRGARASPGCSARVHRRDRRARGARGRPCRRWPGGSRRPAAFAAVPATGSRPPTWLDEHPTTGTALLAPGSAFGELRVGDPAGRAAPVPRAQPLGGAQRRPARARRQHPDARRHRAAGSPRATARTGFAPYLRRAGIGYLVVRNDLARLATSPTRCWCTRRSTRRRA